jgi:predicted ATPase/DNA-binding CsgD family transcriptional regulator
MAGRAARSRQGNLPAELTSFVGRRRELAEIKRLLTTTRLLTLTGSGGAGKTRLAVRAASEMARNFSDGVCLVSLAPIDDPLMITQAAFSALGLQDVSSRWSLSALSDYLREKRLLLVLDNCEHVLDSAAVLAVTLLKACPELRILATSRQALGMAGEVRLRVPPLSLPDTTGSVSPAQLAGFDAVALLVERAAAVQPGFVVDESNAASVLQLCARLDGMPLALELAAVRLEGLTVEQLIAGLDRELSAPAMGLRGAEARQRTLEATLDWSYSLLTEKQRVMWARLSVFAGGFNEVAAATVCPSRGSTKADFTQDLAALVESSILQRDSLEQPPRYSMLETVRHYGRQKLRELGEEIQLQMAHREWIRGLAKATSTFDDAPPQAFNVVHLERDNLWSALEFSRRQTDDAPIGIDIVASLTNYWFSRGPLRDVRRYLESLLPATAPNTYWHARCLAGVALFADALDDAVTAETMGTEALRIAGQLGDTELVGWACGSLLFAAFVQSKRDGVAAWSNAMLGASRATGSESMMAVALHYTSLNALGQDDVNEAIEVGEAAVKLCRDAGEYFTRGLVLNTLAEARRRKGELTQAEALGREGIAAKHMLDDRRGIATLVETLAWIASDARDNARAAMLLGCAQSLRDSMAIPILTPWVPQHNARAEITKERLGETGFRKAFVQGIAMSVAEVVDYALGQTPVKPAAAATAAKPSTVLSRRELEIARLIAEGLTNKEVAARLFISIRTVETHVTNMLNKLGLSSRTQLARWVG